MREPVRVLERVCVEVRQKVFFAIERGLEIHRKTRGVWKWMRNSAWEIMRIWESKWNFKRVSESTKFYILWVDELHKNVMYNWTT